MPRALLVRCLLPVACLLFSCHYRVIAYGEVDPRAVEKVFEKTARIRALSPLRPIRAQLITPRALDEELREEFARASTSGLYERYSEAMIALGFLPPATDVKEVSRSIYSSGTGGYYDSEEEILRIISRPLFRSEAIEIIGALRGQDPVFGEVLSHELAHALVDQHFDLDSFLDDGGETDEDVSLARRAVAEGDAWVVGFLYQGGKLAQYGARLRGLVKRAKSLAPGEGAPWPLRATFVFPYLQGGLFVDAVLQEGGFAALDAVYRNPPRATSEILHPERYLHGPRVEVRRPILQPLYERWDDFHKLLLEDTLGEFQLSLLLGRFLKEEEAQAAAEGWSGDRFAVIKGSGAPFVLWATVWEGEAEAEEFFRAMRAFTEKRYASSLAWLESGEERVIALHSEGIFGMLRDGERVVITDRLPEEETNALLSALLTTIPPQREPAE